MSDPIIYKRPVEDKDDEYLLSIGWKFVGISLFQYPHDENIRGCYTKEETLALTEKYGLGLYCPSCGACGEEDCCPPEKCNCFYRAHYDKSYKTLMEENETMYKYISDVITSAIKIVGKEGKWQ